MEAANCPARTMFGYAPQRQRLPLTARVDLVCRGRCFLPEQGAEAHDLAGGAVAALEAISLDEGFLQRVQIVAVADPLDGGDLPLRAIHGQGQAGVDRPAIDLDCAGAAVPPGRRPFLSPSAPGHDAGHRAACAGVQPAARHRFH